MPRVTISDEVFKKPEQVVGKPETTTHNINDEYMRNAPNNTDRSVNQHKNTYESAKARRRMSVSIKEGAYERELARTLVEGETLRSGLRGMQQTEDLGRAKKEEELADIAQEDAVHS